MPTPKNSIKKRPAKLDKHGRELLARLDSIDADNAEREYFKNSRRVSPDDVDKIAKGMGHIAAQKVRRTGKTALDRAAEEKELKKGRGKATAVRHATSKASPNQYKSGGKISVSRKKK